MNSQKGTFSQESFVAFKKKLRIYGPNFPPAAAGNIVRCYLKIVLWRQAPFLSFSCGYCTKPPDCLHPLNHFCAVRSVPMCKKAQPFKSLLTLGRPRLGYEHGKRTDLRLFVCLIIRQICGLLSFLHIFSRISTLLVRIA